MGEDRVHYDKIWTCARLSQEGNSEKQWGSGFLHCGHGSEASSGQYRNKWWLLIRNMTWWDLIFKSSQWGCHDGVMGTISFSRVSSQLRGWTHVSCINRWILYYLSHQRNPSKRLFKNFTSLWGRERIYNYKVSKVSTLGKAGSGVQSQKEIHLKFSQVE